MRPRTLALATALLTTACGSSGEPLDPTPRDGGPTAPTPDAGPHDGGTRLDAGDVEPPRDGGVRFQPPGRPTTAFFGTDDIVYVPLGDTVYRYDLTTDEFVSPISAGADLDLVAYSEVSHRLFFVVEDEREIRTIDLASPAPASFATLDNPVRALVPAGPFLFAASGFGQSSDLHHVLDGRDGHTVAEIRTVSSPAFGFDEANGRMFLFRYFTDDNLAYETIDPQTGALAWGESSVNLYFGDQKGPIVPSPDGRLVLLGTGDLVDPEVLGRVTTLEIEPEHAVWLPDGTLMTSARDRDSFVDHWALVDGRFVRVDFTARFAARAIALLHRGGRVVLVTSQGNEGVRVIELDVSTDADQDGVPYDEDAFPLDPAASVDSDGDGHPDAWNPGESEASSTTGLTVDAFAEDPECFDVGDALPTDPTRCDLANGVPAIVPDDVLADANGTVYLLASAERRIYRWSADDRAYATAIRLAWPDAVAFAVSDVNRAIYVGYASGLVERIDLDADLAVRRFARLDRPTNSMTAAEGALVVSPGRDVRAFSTFRDDGQEVGRDRFSSTPASLAWSPGTNRVYFVGRNLSPNDLKWIGVTPATAAVYGEGDSDYHGDFLIAPPARPTTSGRRVIVGTGEVYDGATLEMIGGVPVDPVDAAWLDDDELFTIRSVDLLIPETWVERWRWSSGRYVRVNAQRAPGDPVRIISTAAHDVILVTATDVRPRIERFVPIDDGDGDGVPYVDDAFPFDPAASVDTDQDGAPDAWNPGYDASQSTLGLELDAFPLNSACQTTAHGHPMFPNQCDVLGRTPEYVPDAVIMSRDETFYLLDAARGRVHRRSSSTPGLDPIVLPWPATEGEASHIAFGDDTHTLYVAYPSGAIYGIDVGTNTSTVSRPRLLNTIANDPLGLLAVGSNVFAADRPAVLSHTSVHYVFRPTGERATLALRRESSARYAWNATYGRVLYFDQSTSRRLAYAAVDAGGTLGPEQFTGMSFDRGPIVVSQDGERLLFGDGAIHDAGTFAYEETHTAPRDHAAWRANGGLVTIRRAGLLQTSYERWAPDLTNEQIELLEGDPLAVFTTPLSTVVVTKPMAGVSFFALPP